VKERRLNEVKGLILVAAAIIIFLSLASFNHLDLSFYTSHPSIPPKNLIRTFGALLAGVCVFLIGRLTSFCLPLLLAFLGVRYFQQEKPDLRFPKVLGIIVWLLSISSFLGLIGLDTETAVYSRSGFLGFLISKFVTSYFGRVGGYVIFSTLIILSSALITDILISSFFLNVTFLVKFLIRLFPRIKLRGPREARVDKRETVKPPLPQPSIQKAEPAVVPLPAAPKPKIQIKTAKPTEIDEAKIKAKEVKIGEYQLPSLDLLESPPPFEARQIKDDLTSNARVLEETLEDFGISVKVTDIERGPVITRYELEPAPGVKLNKIVALGDDIALAMKAQSVRIIAPIPGKGRVGVEVPNSQSSFVYLKEVLASTSFQKAESKLSLALGKDITGQAVVADLDEMPHLLIAGTTGSGKTVCVNSLILSILFRAAPHELKFVMVDPKMVELAPFNGLPHLLCPVVTESKKATYALNWVVNEMEERYQLLAKVGARNIQAYNAKQEEKLPYIVVIVDEFADLMAVTKDQVETAVTRLAQLSRAVGIHLILATQRPSVDVITGIIKANLPARISFKVASKVDSRTVLDMNGADKLLGKGDLLFLKPGESKLIRIQGTLVTDREIEKVVSFIKSQGEPVYDDNIVKGQEKSGTASGERDDLYDEAVRVVMETNQASVSILQRRMRLGYTRAARMIDMMEQDGYVGPYEGSKPRKILIDRDAWMREHILPKEGGA
jgi:S-DNA-T family DNA segregation ATPase FtsK/SpoIIIE